MTTFEHESPLVSGESPAEDPQKVSLSQQQIERAELRAKPEQSNFMHVQLPDLPVVSAQICGPEKRYLYELLRDGYTGAGTVVEVGCWLGSSTLCLAAGLRDSGLSGTLHTFDRFIWGGAADNAKSGLELEMGDDFQPYFEENIASLREWVKITCASFEKIIWSGEPIDILFLDGPKTAQQLSVVLSTLGPSLISGHSMVVLRNYHHPTSYEMPLAIQQLSEHLELRHVVLSGGTAAFLVTNPLKIEDTALDKLSIEDTTVEEALQAWDSICQPMVERVRYKLRSAEALHLCDLGDVSRAIEILKDVHFDPHLHNGWSNWRKNTTMLKRYEPLFDVYMSELQEGK